MTMKGMMAAAALALLAGSAVAHPGHEDGAKVEKREVKRIIIEHTDGTTREIEPAKMKRLALKEACGEGQERFETGDSTTEDGKTRKNRVVICATGGKPMLAALEGARDSLAKNEALAEAHRAKALAALDAEIARLKQNGAN